MISIPSLIPWRCPTCEWAWNFGCSLDQKLDGTRIMAKINQDPHSWALHYGTTKMQKGWTFICMECGGMFVARPPQMYLDVNNVHEMNFWNQEIKKHLYLDDEQKIYAIEYPVPGQVTTGPGGLPVPGVPTTPAPAPPPPPQPPTGECFMEAYYKGSCSTR